MLLPIILGAALNHWFAHLAAKVGMVSPLVSVVFILLIVGFILAAKRDIILEHGWILLAATSLLHAGGFFSGYFSSRLFRQGKIDSQTLSIEVGMQIQGWVPHWHTKHFL